MQFRALFFLIGASFLVTLSGCSRGPEQIGLTGSTMGTTWSVKVVSQSSPDAHVLQNEIQGELDLVNGLMSNWDPNSEVSQFNRAAAGCYPISQHTFRVADVSMQLTELSDGLFDVTVGPLIELWGFGTEFTADQMPSQEAIDETLKRVDHDFLALNPGEWCKSIDELFVNLSATAKGYGVDLVAEKLESHGFENYLVEVGGELRVSGNNLQGEPWRVGIEKPAADSSDQMVQGVLELTSGAVATSGDYRNYFEHEGVIYSHIIDPRSGYPVPHEVASVTVVHDSALWADGWATALLAMGPEVGLQMADAIGLKVMMVVRSGEGYVERTSQNW